MPPAAKPVLSSMARVGYAGVAVGVGACVGAAVADAATDADGEAWALGAAHALIAMTSAMLETKARELRSIPVHLQVT